MQRESEVALLQPQYKTVTRKLLAHFGHVFEWRALNGFDHSVHHHMQGIHIAIVDGFVHCMDLRLKSRLSQLKRICQGLFDDITLRSNLLDGGVTVRQDGDPFRLFQLA